MKKNLFALASIALTACFLFGCGNSTSNSSSLDSSSSGSSSYSVPEDGWTYSNKVMYAKDMGLVTGKDGFTDTTKWQISGTDLGFSYFDESINRYYCVFGDTSGTWNSNVTFYTDDLDFSDGIHWDGMMPGAFGAYSQVTPVSQRIASRYGYTYDSSLITCTDVTTTIPTGAVVVNGTYYLFYMEVGTFKDNGEWDVFASGVTKSSDQGKTWSVVSGLRWISKNAAGETQNGYNFGQIFPMVADDYLYIYGIPGGRSGGTKLGRVSLSNMEDINSYEYFYGRDGDGKAVYKAGNNGLNSIVDRTASYVVDPSCGELSVCYNPYLQRYMMTYMQNNSQIVLRRASTPDGVWSSSDALVKQSDIKGLYGGICSPCLFEDGGRKVYLLVSEWDIYNVHQIEVVFN